MNLPAAVLRATLSVTLLVGAVAAQAPATAVPSAPPSAPMPAPMPAQDEDITPASILAVERALAYLAETQNADGTWTADVGFKLNQSYQVTVDDRPHVGVTALAGIAFLSAGHLPGRGIYGDVIRRATDAVLACVQDDGFITRNETRMYSHAFATLFLAEVYGMTDRQDVRAKLQSAVDLIVAAQNAEGAWRYVPHAVESDMSIAVCQLNALRGARNVGIRVPKSTIERARKYVARSYVSDNEGGGRSWDSYYRSDRGSFRYQVSQGRSRSSFALTAAGIAALHNSGVYGNDPGGGEKTLDLQASISFLIDNYDLVSARSPYGFHYFYWYGHYYATQALYVVGGQAWRSYYPRVRGELIAAQRADGSLPCPVGPGPAFSTAVGAIILSLPYGYLPIFQR
ncbi:MAG: prenyltransferase/squalene oxidase repeat-containing protein [Planctomycetota bacterium]